MSPSWVQVFTIFWACGPAGWLALLLTKAGDVETNPGPTTLNKQVCICDICQKQIHVRKHISMRCNRIEHWVHLRCADICLAQYTDTWTCHLHISRPWSKTPTHSPPTPPQPKHRHMYNTPPSSSSCHQTSGFHLSTHFFAVSLNLLRSSNEQGCARRVHCIMSAVFSVARPHSQVVSPS